jgi:diacylglycerol kinase (ATP)
MTTFTISARLRSFKYAFRGIGLVVTSQHNAWIHVAATLVVVSVGLWVQLSRLEWCSLVLAIVAVFTAEALNTAIEYVTDLTSPEFHVLAGKAKDAAAGAVLIAAFGAVLVGCLVFGIRLLGWLHRFG